METEIESQLNSNRKNWFTRHMFLGIVFLIAVFGAAASLINYWQVTSQIPSKFYAPVHKEKVDPTANWKTYTNTEYGFEFKYPNNWSVDSCESNKTTIIFNPACGTDMPQSYIAVSDSKIYNTSFNEYRDDTFPHIVTRKQIQIDGHSAEVFSWEVKELVDERPLESLGSKERLVIFTNDKYLFEISISRDYEIFDQILSTFKFIDSNLSKLHKQFFQQYSGSAPSDWRVYTSELYGFEFKHPPSINICITPSKVVELTEEKDCNKEGQEFVSGMWIYVKANPKRLSLYEWWNENGYDSNDIVQVIINGLDALEILVDPKGLPEVHYLINHDDKVIDIFDNLKDSHKILSTFKFTQ